MDINYRKIVYFVRHGQSVDNGLPVFQSINSPLSENGNNQAISIANRLSALQFESLISSPIQRAKETAAYISKKTGKKIEYSGLFVERIKPDEISGKSWNDLMANKVWRDWEKTLYEPGENHIGNGENYDDIVNRADKALSFLVNHKSNTLVVVTHGHFLRAIVARVLFGDNLTGKIMRQFQERASMENTGITVLIYKDAFEEGHSWRLWTYNDHSHFAE